MTTAEALSERRRSIAGRFRVGMGVLRERSGLLRQRLRQMAAWFGTRSVGDVLAIIGILLTIVIYLASRPRSAQPAPHSIPVSATSPQRAAPSNATTIPCAVTWPKSGARVGPWLKVRGTGPYGAGQNLYLVVTSPQDVMWVQTGAMQISTAGTWAGRARIGQGLSGLHQRFKISCLATKSRLKPGELEVEPEDAPYSSSVEVERTQ
jgi:hypothetical protein